MRVGDPLTGARRQRVVELLAAAIGGGAIGAQLARERVVALAPREVVTEALAEIVGRAIALATPRCAVCLEPSVDLHPVCRVLHAEQLAAANRAELAEADRSIHWRGARRRR